MRLERPPEQPLRRAQARVVVELEIAQRQQVPARILILVGIRPLGTSKPKLELVDVTRVRAQRLAGRRIAVELEPVTERAEQLELELAQSASDALRTAELREAATIAGKGVGIRIAARREPQQKLVDVEAREHPLSFERMAWAVGFDVREPAEVAAADPRELQRRERLQQRALALPGSTRAARDEAQAPVRGRHALEQLARIAVRSLVQHERRLEQHLFALRHYTSKPSLCSSRSLSAQCSRTLTHSSRCTRSPSSCRSSCRANVPACLRTLPALPMTIFF